MLDKPNVFLNFRFKKHQQHVKKQETNKSSVAKLCWENNHTFDFSFVKIIFNHIFKHEFNFLGAFHIFRNFNNIVNFEFVTPPLSDFWKYFIKISLALFLLSFFLFLRIFTILFPFPFYFHIGCY